MTPTPTPPCLGEREAVARTGAMTAEEIAEATAADPFCQPAPPSIPVRGRYYLTECEHCGWVGSSEQCRPDDEDVICPACLLSICGDGPDEADTAKHGEAVYQRIVTAEAERDAAIARAEEAERGAATMRAKAEEQVAYWRQRQVAEKCLEDGISEDGETYTPIGDEAAWQAGYCNGRMSEADWWRSTFKYEFPALTTPEHPHGD
ncbi:hypothetical protein [Methylobacterium sp. WL19]|uniref:hypothetical protein n=1 Tax=Methylobacterium sp. WL19 TaxID=2603896 RepID=UPI0011CB483F|nr:hypothetical protein [Methylobacterium sp. WL19]TXN33941.1 hypothetical protein FV220_00390 [Methylobacterium sp. WL19]